LLFYALGQMQDPVLISVKAVYVTNFGSNKKAATRKNLVTA
jgi:hypothetical protein